MTTPLPASMTVSIGMLLRHNPSGVTFKVLCNCKNVMPEHHRQRYVSQHRELYSLPETQTPAPAASSTSESEKQNVQAD